MVTKKIEAELDINLMWDFCLVEAIESKKETGGGIILPNKTALADTVKGLVLKAGPGTVSYGRFVPNPVKAGDYVYYIGSRVPYTINLNSKEYLLISAQDMVATGLLSKEDAAEREKELKGMGHPVAAKDV